MDFSYTEEEKMFKDTARKFAEKEIAPLIKKMEKEDRTPRELIKRLKDLDFCAIPFPEEYGGVGASYLDYLMVIEELSRVSSSIAESFSVMGLCAMAILNFGTEEQKKKYLPELLHGEAVGSFAFTEASTGTDPRAITTKAVLDGNEWVINGEKLFITNSPIPGYIIIFCKCEEVGGDIVGIIVPKDTEGYSTPKRIEKLGMRGLEVAEVLLEDVRVPYENLVGGKENIKRGFEMMVKTIQSGKLDQCAECVGRAQAALEEAVKYANERTQRGKPITKFQTIQWLLGEMSSDVVAARYMTYAAGDARSKGKNITYDSARTRLFASQAAHRVVSNAMQVMGAYGFTTEFDMERLWRDSKFPELTDGTNEIQRMIAASEFIR